MITREITEVVKAPKKSSKSKKKHRPDTLLSMLTPLRDIIILRNSELLRFAKSGTAGELHKYICLTSTDLSSLLQSPLISEIIEHSLSNEHTDIILYLLDNGLDPYYQYAPQMWLFETALTMDYVELVVPMANIIHSHSPEYDFTQLLFYALTKLRLNSFHGLIETGKFDLNSISKRGELLINICLKNMLFDSFYKLLAHGANPLLKDRNGVDVLHILNDDIFFTPHPEERAKAMAELRPIFSSHMVACYLHRDHINFERYLTSGADINAAGPDDTRLISAAVAIADIEIIEYLCRLGIDPRLKDNEGRDAFDYLQNSPAAAYSDDPTLRSRVKSLLLLADSEIHPSMGR